MWKGTLKDKCCSNVHLLFSFGIGKDKYAIEPLQYKCQATCEISPLCILAEQTNPKDLV